MDIESLCVLRLLPGQVLIVTVNLNTTPEAIRVLANALSEKFPNNDIVVVVGGTRFSVAGGI